MKFDASGGISIAELVVYTPALFLALLVCIRHGFHKSSGWIYTIVLCLIRIIGAVCQLLTYSNQSTGLIEATTILETVGLSPLLLATLGLLSRLTNWVNMASSSPMFNPRYFRIFHIIVVVGLGLSIAGGTSTNISTETATIDPPTTSKVGVVLYIIALVGCVVILFLSSASIHVVPPLEKPLAFAVGLAIPFIVVRLAYTVLVVFVHNHTFSLIHGSVAAHVVMGVASEIVVIAIYLVLGFRLQKLVVDERGTTLSEPWNRKNYPDREELRDFRGNGHERARRHG